MDFNLIFQPDNLHLYLGGLLQTLKLLVISLACGLVLALPLALARSSRLRILCWPVWLFTYAIRGTPLLVQVYMVYYGIAQLDWVQARWDAVWPWTWFKQPLFCTLLAFTINTAAYTVELIAGAIKATPAGEIEAGLSLGMSTFTLYRRILLPSALRRALPGYGNEVILMLHATSVASVVPSIIDITAAANSVYSTYYVPFEAFISAGAIYLVLTFCFVQAFRLMEKRWLGHLQARKN